MLVTVINRTDDMALVGHKYLLPGEGRRVTMTEYLQAAAVAGSGLESPDAPSAALVLADDTPALIGDEDEDEDEPAEYSLEVLDGEADARDLAALSRGELVEMARARGIVPGRKTKSELIEALHEYAD